MLILLVPCVALTLYYSQVVAPGSEESGSFLPTTSYALVLLLVNLDLIGFVVLVLLLSRNLIKAYFERRHRLVGIRISDQAHRCVYRVLIDSDAAPGVRRQWADQ